MAKTVTADTVAQITRNLADFGYEGLTIEQVQAEVDKSVQGEEPSNIIGKFVHGMLVENGYIEE